MARRRGDAEGAPRSLILSRQTLDEVEIGARLHALLLFPVVAEDASRQAAADAMVAERLQLTLKLEPSLRPRLSEVWPHLVALDKRDIRRALKTTRRRYRDRMAASRMSLGFLEEGLTGYPAKLPKSMGGKHTVEKLSELVLRDSGESSSENVRKRAWSKTRPVLHLAAAFQVVIRLWSEAPTVGLELDDPILNDLLVEQAGRHERILLADPRFSKWSHQLVRIRLTDGASEF